MVLIPLYIRCRRPGAVYWVRIFTQTGDIPFAGHPTLGSVRAWIDDGSQPRAAATIVQECSAELVELRQENGLL